MGTIISGVKLALGLAICGAAIVAVPVFALWLVGKVREAITDARPVCTRRSASRARSRSASRSAPR